MDLYPNEMKELIAGKETVIYALLHLFGLCNALANPILYGYLNENFRKEYKNIYRQMPWHSTSKAEGMEVAVRYQVVKRDNGEETTDVRQPAIITIDNNNVNIVGPAWIAQRLIFAAAAAAASNPKPSDSNDESAHVHAAKAATRAFLQSVDEDVLLEVVPDTGLPQDQVNCDDKLESATISLSLSQAKNCESAFQCSVMEQASSRKSRPPLKRLKAIKESDDVYELQGDESMSSAAERDSFEDESSVSNPGEEVRWFLLSTGPSSSCDSQGPLKSQASFHGFQNRKRLTSMRARRMSFQTVNERPRVHRSADIHQVRIMSIESFRSQRSVDETGLTTEFSIHEEPTSTFYSIQEVILNATKASIIDEKSCENGKSSELVRNGSVSSGGFLPAYYDELKALNANETVLNPIKLNGSVKKLETRSRLLGFISKYKRRSAGQVFTQNNHPVEMDDLEETAVW